jgi:hypothetical protein
MNSLYITISYYAATSFLDFIWTHPDYSVNTLVIDMFFIPVSVTNKARGINFNSPNSILY